MGDTMSYMYGYDNLMKDDSLEHYGVLGMKWEVRKKYKNQYKQDRKNRIRKASKPGRRISEAIGDRNKSAKLHYKSLAEKEIASNAKTSLGRRIHAQKSANYEYQSEYYNKVANMDAGQKFFEKSIFKSEMLNTPYQRLSGRTTTLGKKYLDDSLTLGIGGLIGDFKERTS